MVLGLGREGLVVMFHPTWVGRGWIEVGWVGVGWDGSDWLKRSGGLRNPRMPEIVSRVINNTTGPAPGFTLRRRQCLVSIRWVASARPRYAVNPDPVGFTRSRGADHGRRRTGGQRRIGAAQVRRPPLARRRHADDAVRGYTLRPLLYRSSGCSGMPHRTPVRWQAGGRAGARDMMTVIRLAAQAEMECEIRSRDAHTIN